MRVIADLHIHSPYSRAVSPKMSIPNLDLWASKKGITVMGTGDFTQPQWLKHLEKELIPAETGLFKYKQSSSNVRFILSAEISSIYKDKGKVRRVHNLIFAPSFKVVENINNTLEKLGAKLKSDGRPIVGISSRKLLNIALEASNDSLFVPAHIWTPWFAVFGSKSGYNSLEECFGDDEKYIYALETGLSSDPGMNYRLSQLDNKTLISNSDSHSLEKIGREANVFEIEKKDFNYAEITRIIKEKDTSRFKYTIEYYPEEGRYYYDGHKEHNLSFHPKESSKLKKNCPQCGKKLTIGVLSRVEELADRPEGYQPKKYIPGRHLVPLAEIIAEVVGVKTITSKKVQKYYESLTSSSQGGELGILLDEKLDVISQNSLPAIAEGVRRVREGELNIVPGYDGVYGQVKIFKNKKLTNN